MWTNIVQMSVPVLDTKNAQTLGTRHSRTCRFCGQTDQKAFLKIAHVLPAAFGNRSLFSYEECDRCNSEAGESTESHLCSLLALPRAISRFPTRKGNPKIKPGKEAFIASNYQVNRVFVRSSIEDKSIEFKEIGDNQLSITCSLPPYSPDLAGRAIARMACFLLKTGSVEYSRLCDWACRRTDVFPYPMMFVPLPQRQYANNELSLSVDRFSILGRHIVKITFRFSMFMVAVAFAMDGQNLPPDLKLYTFPSTTPLEIRVWLLHHMTSFLVNDGSIRSGDQSMMTFTYGSKSLAEPGQYDWVKF